MAHENKPGLKKLDAYRQGFCHYQPAVRFSNPYSVDSQEASAYRLGWSDAEQERETHRQNKLHGFDDSKFFKRQSASAKPVKSFEQMQAEKKRSQNPFLKAKDGE